MLLLFSFRVAERSPVWERAVHSVSVRVFDFVCVLLSLCFFIIII